MQTEKLQARTTVQRPSLRRWWWLIVGIAIISALVVIRTNQAAPVAPVANAATLEQSDPAASIARSKSLGDYDRAHQFEATNVQTDPAASIARSKSLGDYDRAHRFDAVNVQTVPDAAMQGVLGYIQAHQGVSGQTVTNTNTQASTNYIDSWRFDLIRNRVSGQLVPDAATQGIMGYIQAHQSVDGQLVSNAAK